MELSRVISFVIKHIFFFLVLIIRIAWIVRKSIIWKCIIKVSVCTAVVSGGHQNSLLEISATGKRPENFNYEHSLPRPNWDWKPLTLNHSNLGHWSSCWPDSSVDEIYSFKIRQMRDGYKCRPWDVSSGAFTTIIVCADEPPSVVYWKLK